VAAQVKTSPVHWDRQGAALLACADCICTNHTHTTALQAAAGVAKVAKSQIWGRICYREEAFERSQAAAAGAKAVETRDARRGWRIRR